MNEYAIRYSLRMHARALNQRNLVMGGMHLHHDLNAILEATAHGRSLNEVIELVPKRYRLPDDFSPVEFCREMIRLQPNVERWIALRESGAFD